MSANLLLQGSRNGRLKLMSLLKHTDLQRRMRMSAFLLQKSCSCIITTSGNGAIGIHLLGLFSSLFFGLLAVHLESGPVSRPIQTVCF